MGPGGSSSGQSRSQNARAGNARRLYDAIGARRALRKRGLAAALGGVAQAAAMAPAVQPAEVQFAQRLASSEKGIRDRAVRKLRQYLSVKTQSETGGRPRGPPRHMAGVAVARASGEPSACCVWAVLGGNGQVRWCAEGQRRSRELARGWWLDIAVGCREKPGPAWRRAGGKWPGGVRERARAAGGAPSTAPAGQELRGPRRARRP